MFGKLMEMKQKMEELKKRLDSLSVSAQAGNGAVTVEMNGNRQVLSVRIQPELIGGGNEETEELLAVAFNRALEQANALNEREMASMAGAMLPGMPGLFS